MEKTLEVLNRLEAGGLICRCAIGRAIPAAYHVEPTVADDLDSFRDTSQPMIPHFHIPETKWPHS
jgi:hypothetical protein